MRGGWGGWGGGREGGGWEGGWGEYGLLAANDKTERARGQGRKTRGDRKGESNGSHEISDRRETLDIPGLLLVSVAKRKSPPPPPPHALVNWRMVLFVTERTNGQDQCLSADVLNGSPDIPDRKGMDIRHPRPPSGAFNKKEVQWARSVFVSRRIKWQP